MKKLALITLIHIVCLQACSQPKELNQMTTQDWEQDLDYLNKKIQKEFQSFIPGIKDEFNKEVSVLRSRLSGLQNYKVACEIMRLFSTLKDGHTELNVGHQKVGFHRVPLSLYFFSKRIVYSGCT